MPITKFLVSVSPFGFASLTFWRGSFGTVTPLFIVPKILFHEGDSNTLNLGRYLLTTVANSSASDLTFKLASDSLFESRINLMNAEPTIQ